MHFFSNISLKKRLSYAVSVGLLLSTADKLVATIDQVETRSDETHRGVARQQQELTLISRISHGDDSDGK